MSINHSVLFFGSSTILIQVIWRSYFYETRIEIAIYMESWFIGTLYIYIVYLHIVYIYLTIILDAIYMESWFIGTLYIYIVYLHCIYLSNNYSRWLLIIVTDMWYCYDR